jgi:hypothetical protein
MREKVEGMLMDLEPDFDENQLCEYFYQRIWEGGLAGFSRPNPYALQRGLGCTAAARLIVMDLGGPKKARIYWVNRDGHAYVIKNGQAPEEPAYNNSLSKTPRPLPIRTVKFVREFGRDVTDKYFKLSWAELNLM